VKWARGVSEGEVMLCVRNALARFFVQEDGPTAVEYAFMLALIILVCIAAVQGIGTKTSANFSSVQINNS